MSNHQNTNISLYAIAMKLMARRERSETELRQKLIARDFDSCKIDKVIDDLLSRNLLSDKRFAEAYTKSRSRKGYGPVRIKNELNQRGVNDDIVQICLANEADQWESRAFSARRKKFGINLPSEFKEKARQMRFLEYRGFTTNQINSAFDFGLSDLEQN
ncbi:MAG: regulatory protein RecX [Pseudomonadota bacterium]|nr:regulatory protein RecX [Pseudomonadota bacterium]